MVWTARTNGLTGTALNVNYITQLPGTRHISNTHHELLIAADAGIFQTFNGGREWAQIILPDPSNAEFADSPAATVDELTFHWVDYDPANQAIVYVLGVKVSNNRFWFYKSTDSGLSWTSRGIETS